MANCMANFERTKPQETRACLAANDHQKSCMDCLFLNHYSSKKNLIDPFPIQVSDQICSFFFFSFSLQTTNFFICIFYLFWFCSTGRYRSCVSELCHLYFLLFIPLQVWQEVAFLWLLILKHFLRVSYYSVCVILEPSDVHWASSCISVLWFPFFSPAFMCVCACV